MRDAITVTISGKAWHAMPIGADPHFTPDREELRRIRSAAKVIRCGRGCRVVLTGSRGDLAVYARALDDDAYINLYAADTPGAKREGEACRVAAQKLWHAIHGISEAANG